jgi:hypothetical protein
MPEVTDDVLATFSEDEIFRISGIRYASDSRYLGAAGVSDNHPIFHAGGLSGELSPDSRFMLKKRASRVFVVFRQFDSSRYQAVPEDLVAGWVPAEQEGEAQGWVDRMNAHIKEFRVTEH